jgi:hypothetical protein
MSYAWGNFLAVLAAFFSIALIVAVGAWSHNLSTGQIYAAAVTALRPTQQGTSLSALAQTITTSTADEPARESILSAAREGARWAHGIRCEQTVWAVIILILLLVVLGYHFWMLRLPQV